MRFFLLSFVVVVSSLPCAAFAQSRVGEPLTLDVAVAEALDKNLELTALRAGVAIADADLVTARLRPNPVFSVGADHLDVVGTGFDEDNAAGPPEYSARVDLPLERGGKRARRMDVAREARAQAEIDVLERVRTLRYEVQQAFVDLQLARDNQALAMENAASLAEIVALNEARVRSGDVAEVELLRSRVAALQSAQVERAARLEVRTAQQRLERVMGRPPGETPLNIQEVPRPAPVIASAADLRARALRARPDLQSLQRARARSQAELRLQVAQGQMDFTVGTEYRRQQGLAGRGNSLGLFFSMPLPFFDRNQGNVARAGQAARQVDLQEEQLVRTIAGEVELTAARYAAAQTTLAVIESEMLVQARDVRAITDYAYRRGEATLMELLDAQRAFNDTMQAYHEARAEYARSVFGVRTAVGEDSTP